MANILVIEDESILARNICDSLELAGHQAVSVGSGEEGIELASVDRPDLIITDFRLPGIDGLQVLRHLRENDTTASVIIVTAYGEVSTAVEAMKAGASEFLTKPLDLQELQLVVEKAIRLRNVTDELNYLKEQERAKISSHSIIGDSEPIRRVKVFIERVVSTPALSAKKPPSILITGETGTGKDLLARTIHYAGPRRDAKFVHVNCTAIPDQLAESQLFGHVKGAFTDARSDHRGLIEHAEGGTLFLDEIGHMSLALQAKLLHVLEERTIRPVGGTRERQANIHIIASTNRNLTEALDLHEFREDLYHRLRVLAVEMPPLRDRGEDIEKLAVHFLDQSTQRFGVRIDGFSKDAMHTIRNYDWPGNVRELMHVVESATLIADGQLICIEHLNISASTSSGTVAIQLDGLNDTICLDFGGDCPKLDEVEHRIIQAALTYSNHNLSRAARILGISRDAIRYRVDKFAKNHGDENDGN